MKTYLLLFLLVSAFTSQAQIQDAWVYFTDKPGSEEALEDPLSILTQESLDRKALHNVSIDLRDVPVDQGYIDQVKAATGVLVLAKSKWLNCVYVQGTQEDLEALLDLPMVQQLEFADKDLNLLPAPSGRNNKFELEDSFQRVTYDYGAAENQISMIGADFLHQQELTGEGMIIAVLDSGFPNVNSIQAFDHIVSDGRLLGTYNFVERQVSVTGTGSHGTRTFSDMGALLEGQIVGTAPGASYYLFRTEFAPTEVPVEEAYWVEALERADSLGVDVVNTSLGYQDYDNPNYDHSYEDLDGETTFSARGANIAFEKGMLLVTSAGNDGGGFTFVGTPADAPGVLTVGAVTASGEYASFSSIGPTVDGRVKPDVMAQGSQAAVINGNGNLDFSSGTSFSSPITAGAVASLWQFRPETTNAELMQIIRESSSLFDDPTDQMGYGIPDFEEAYQRLQTLAVEDNLERTRFGIWPNPATDVVMINFPEGIQGAELTVYNVLGEVILRSSVNANTPQFNISRLGQGMYILSLEGNNLRQSLKLIKR
ncbi:S8 family serine peptidase [Aureitalea marina]|uniref:Serine protease n=1 Tax=Aureitalea marina TaxID=930804 RepID=A0A2S7KQ55_9FLAO|nr:S8 family serine peptidase [Aureitalea marina]PQB04756.1 serine protease [Aureitalea marina]